ncbi:Endoglucanase 2 [Spatholobus suberectus]|nr:Endoglucanase 2 [Spatholobus suberectus]
MTATAGQFPILALIVGIVVYTIKKKIGHTDSKRQLWFWVFLVPLTFALKTIMQFFYTQKFGKLVNNKITWGGDSTLKDGSQARLDLSKGFITWKITSQNLVDLVGYAAKRGQHMLLYIYMSNGLFSLGCNGFPPFLW